MFPLLTNVIIGSAIRPLDFDDLITHHHAAIAASSPATVVSQVIQDVLKRQEEKRRPSCALPIGHRSPSSSSSSLTSGDSLITQSVANHRASVVIDQAFPPDGSPVSPLARTFAVSMNDEIERLLGYSREELIERKNRSGWTFEASRSWAQSLLSLVCGINSCMLLIK
jgi:PAS domain-containing protein